MFRGIRFFLTAILAILLMVSQAHSEEAEPEFIHLYQYKPIYFLMGNPYTKIELSFKAQIVKSVPLYFGYTQLMMWDLFIPSPYFYDINYNPELFYRHLISGEQWLDFSPFEHESNGKGGSEERSWNRLYVRYHTQTKIGETRVLYWDLKAWVPFYQNPNNPNLDQFRGIWEVNLTLTRFLNPYFNIGDVSLRVYPGGRYFTNPVFGGQELTVRVRAGQTILPSFVGQIFHGYGENLLDYNVNRWGFRAGIGF